MARKKKIIEDNILGLENITDVNTQESQNVKLTDNSIFIQIASYRDPELGPTINELINKADHPENLKICINHQYNPDDSFSSDLDQYHNDSRFIIIDTLWSDSQGACFERNKIQQHYNNEKYTLQLDSHHRFQQGYDTELINMLVGLQEKGHKKPLLTSYIPSYNPDNDPEERVQAPWWLTFDRFIPEGAVFFLPATIPNWESLTEPIPGRFYSAHFAFTLGEFCINVQHDPQYYFHGEEIAIAVRAFTHGYDIFHPHKIIAWHEYTRRGRTKQWDDDPVWGERNNKCHQRNRALFGMDGECLPCHAPSFGKYGFGTERTLDQYERFSGLRFSTRGVQQYTLDNKLAPNPIIEDEEEYNASFLNIFKHCIDLGYDEVPLEDYHFWVVVFEDKDGNDIYREDVSEGDIPRLMDDPDGYIKLWRQFSTLVKPVKIIVWPYSHSQGWSEKIIKYI